MKFNFKQALHHFIISADALVSFEQHNSFREQRDMPNALGDKLVFEWLAYGFAVAMPIFLRSQTSKKWQQVLFSSHC